MGTAHAPIHPGEILLEEFLVPLGISQYRLAQDRRATASDQRDRARQAVDQPGYSAAIVPGHSARRTGLVTTWTSSSRAHRDDLDEIAPLVA